MDLERCAENESLASRYVSYHSYITAFWAMSHLSVSSTAGCVADVSRIRHISWPSSIKRFYADPSSIKEAIRTPLPLSLAPSIPTQTSV